MFHMMHIFRSTFQIRGLRYRPISASPTNQPAARPTAAIHNLLLQEAQLSQSTLHNRNIIIMYTNIAQDAPVLTYRIICLHTLQCTPSLDELKILGTCTSHQHDYIIAANITASAGKAKAGMVYSISRCMRGVQKL